MAGKGCIINRLRSKWRVAPAIAAAMLALAALMLVLRPAPKASQEAFSPPDGLTAYDVTLKVIPDSREISLTETIVFRNDTGDALEDLVLRTWLNAYAEEETSPAALEELYDACYPSGFDPGYLTIYDVIWNGERAQYAFDDGAKTALRVLIPRLEPGEAGELLLRCTGKIPLCAHRAGVAGGIWQLGQVIPTLPMYQDHAWRADPYSPIGDPFVSPCADYTVHAFLPEGFVPACSAPLQKGEDGGWHGGIRGARDIALCVSADYQAASARAGDTEILSFALSQSEARQAAELGKKAVETLSSLYGPCPYPALTLCEVDFPFGGMEYSGLVMLGKGNFEEGKQDSLEATVAHEAAHQWFYSLVGSDQVNAPWQDEALCQFAMLRYVRARYGQGSFETLKYYQADAPMAENIPGDLTPGSPIDYFGSLSDYSAVVYGRGAALILALDEMIPQGMDAFLRAYASAFAYRYATRGAFEALLNEFSGMDCSPLLLDYLDTAR